MAAVAHVLTGILGAAITMGLTLASGSGTSDGRERVDSSVKVAAVMTAVQQTRQAATMAAMMDGHDAVGVGGLMEIVSGGWMVSPARNPTSDQPSGAAVPMVGPDGTRYVHMALVGDNGDLCREVARGFGGEAVHGPVTSRSPGMGCTMSRGGAIAFARY